MKSILTILVIITSSNLSNAQYSTKVNEFIKDLVAIDSKSDTIFYNKGKIKWTSSYTTFRYKAEIYSTQTGKLTQYYKNGQIATEINLGKYGYILSLNSFDKKGNLISEATTVEIDTNAKNSQEFFQAEKHISIKRTIKKYKYTKKSATPYLYQEGQTINGKKIGLWKTYSITGDLEKKKTY